MRITIRLKILGIAIAMLILMTAVSLFNARQINQIRISFSVLSEYYFRAYGEITEGEIESRTASIFHEQFILAYLDGETPERVAAHQDRRVKASAAADQNFAKGGEILRKGESTARNPAEVRALARIVLMFNQTMDVRSALQSKTKAADDALVAGNRDLIKSQQEALEPLRIQFQNGLEQIEQELHSFVEGQANEFSNEESKIRIANLAALVMAASLGLIGSFVLTRTLTRPVLRLVNGAREIEEDNLDIHIPVTSRDEIGGLTEAFNRMIDRLKAKKRIRDTFGMYLDPKIVSALIDRPELANSEGDRRTMTIAFTDLAGFTKLGEGLMPATLLRVINGFLTQMSRAIHRHDGVIDKFIGDAVMAYWGPPFVAADRQAQLACAAALDQVESFATFQHSLPELLGLRQTSILLDLRIGIATGDVVIGDIGSDAARNYTVLGNTVNVAARLEGVNKIYGTRILITEDVAKLAAGQFLLRELDQIVVAGKTEPERIFELIGSMTKEASGLSAYAEGLAAWRNKDWNKAEDAFHACLALRPNDGLSKTFLERLAIVKQTPPSGSWDGVWHLASK